MASNSLHFVKGTPFDLDTELQKGQKVYVLEFWATWCPPCRKSIPHLSELQKKYPDAVFVGITSEDETKVSSFVKGMGSQMDYHVAIDTTEAVSAKTMGKYGIRGIPHAFIYGKDGEIKWHGHPMEQEFEAELKKAISAPSKLLHDPKKMTKEELMALSAKELKEIIRSSHLDATGCIEKEDYVNLIKSSL